ncbi:MAG: endolytic transglycosylase MltG [Candidatus Omnitrophica bacterium]|nr:endolytic transglycosylase MltG [Candidatus Omnitrophota bacterium]MCM8803001.1 endolytic transglycosylase MltG [Candidatus Omnitrophota bacterium]
MKKNKISLIFFFAIIFGFILIKIITLPPLVPAKKLVEIPENKNAYEIGKILKEEGIIKSIKWFLFWTNHYQIQKKLKSGIYEFSGRTPLKKVIEKLVKGEIAIVKIMIPEGSNIYDIAEILYRANLIKDSNEFIEYAKKNNFEGFLFPDTYYFPYNISIEGICTKMWKNFKDVFERIYDEEINEKNWKEVKKIVVVASIVEKEASLSLERKIIAGIIYKRLNKNIPIASCSTVEYALGYKKKRLSKSDLKIRSPYNTYIHKGLPPTPICNPGKDSLIAAINPMKTDYMFFLSKGDGTNHFSKTYLEHLSAIKEYLSNKTSSETNYSEN